MARLEGTDPEKAGINEQKVNAEGQALVLAISETELEHESATNGAAYTWASDSVNPSADDTILLLKNTSDTALHLENVNVSGDADSEYTVHLPTSEVTPTGGSLVTGTNLNTGSSNVADAVARSLETNNSQGNVLYSLNLAGSVMAIVDLRGVILGKNKSIGVDTVIATTLSSVSITGHYAD